MNQEMWMDRLTNEEFDFLMEGLTATKPHESDTSETASSTSCDPCSESTPAYACVDDKDYTDAFEEFLQQVNDPFEEEKEPSLLPVSVDVPSEASDPLLMFLKTHHNCLKSTPEECFQWLNNQDIVTITDLYEACQDTEFVELDLIPSGALKGFKRRPFIKAISNLV